MIVFRHEASRASATPSARVRSVRVGTTVILSTAALIAGLLPSTLAAQGLLSMQGFGYPTGGLSTRALGTAGATGEFDLLSSRNPAAVGSLGRSIASVQAEPEFRTMRLGEVSENTRVQRIPLVAAGLRVQRFAFLISGHTFLDRSFITSSPGTALVGGETVATTDRLESRGAMSELRFASGWTWRGVRLGVGLHALSGEHEVVRERAFPDTLRFGAVQDSSVIGFQGLAGSVGFDWRVSGGLVVAGSWRAGGALSTVKNDTTVTSANVPGRYGLGLSYDGFTGAVLAASVEQVGWSAMNGLGSDNARAEDALNWSAGVELAGGEFRQFPVVWRLGVAQRELPFLLGTTRVSERVLTTGLGIPIGGETATIDFGLQRAQRRIPTGGAQEDAWGLSFGLTIRP